VALAVEEDLQEQLVQMRLLTEDQAVAVVETVQQVVMGQVEQ
jgi:hypothetical protein